MSTAPDTLEAECGTRSRLVAYGSLGICLYLLATSKWGSYLPFTIPPFATDVVFAILVGHYVLYTRRRTHQEDGTPLRFLTAALVFWSSIELVRGSINTTSLRDAAPYFYSLLVFVTVVPPDRVKEKASRWIDIALGFHAFWILLAVAVPSIYKHLPLLAGQINLLGPRNDFDGAVCGIYAAFCIHRALSGRNVALNSAMAIGNAVLMLFLKERAGLLAFVAAMVVVMLLSTDRRRITRGDKAKGLVPVFLLLLPLLALGGAKTPTYQRMLAAVHTFVPVVHASPKYSSDTYTEHNREKAWGRVIKWQDSSSSKETFGVGFGPNFMHESGADVLLLGGANTDVRSPHNYFVGTWARLGLIGLTIVGAIVISGLWLAVVVRRRSPSLEDTDVLAMLVLIGIPAAAAVGVILESPFGAVPYFWALGHLRARAVALRRPERPLAIRRDPAVSVPA